MTSRFQNFMSILIGLALAAFGLVHAVNDYPGPAVFARLMDELPTLLEVATFVLAVAVALAGIILLATSARRLRRRPVRRPGQLTPIPASASTRGYRDNGYPVHNNGGDYLDAEEWERTGSYH